MFVCSYNSRITMFMIYVGLNQQEKNSFVM